jgi:hypothetical protein
VQTWDIAGNEANFFVRDVTGGSLLPFRIRPGAPTSSIDIAPDGDVGMGTASPQANLDIHHTAAPQVYLTREDAAIVASEGLGRLFFVGTTAGTQLGAELRGEADGAWSAGNAPGRLQFFTTGPGSNTPLERMRITSTGSISIVGLPGCSSGIRTDAGGILSCIPSTRRLKNVIGALEPDVALANVMALRPQVGAYKATPDEPEHWLIAEDVAAVEPALVGLRDGEPFTVKTYGVVADLVVVIQLQQRSIEAQQLRIEALEQAIAQR